MKILFRVDAGGKVGLGHFYRSNALADKLHQKGHQVFFSAKKTKFWNKIINNNFPYAFFAINERLAVRELEIIKHYNIDVFFVDAIINFNADYVENIKKLAKVVFYQNISESRNLADVFILPSLHQGKYFFEKFNKSTKVFQGLEYFTFAPIISNLEPKQNLKTVHKIGVISGGSDPKNTLMQFYKKIDFDIFRKQTFTFFYGWEYLHEDSLPKNIARNVTFRKFDYREVLSCDLLISTFGVSTYEFMSLGMPIITAGHQESSANAADFLANKTNALISLGIIDLVTGTVLNQALTELIMNDRLRKKLSDCSKELVDFEGIARIIKIIEGLT